MRISAYLASRFERQLELRGYRTLLERSGLYRVTSRWLDENGLALGKSEADRRRTADMDVVDITRASLFVQFTDDQPQIRGGVSVELGIAIALRAEIIVCGPRTNVFQWHPSVRWIPTVPELLFELGVSEKVQEINDPARLPADNQPPSEAESIAPWIKWSDHGG